MLNLGGTYREVQAEETLARIKPLLLDVFTITRVAPITGLDNIGIYTTVAVRPNSRALANSQGKGLTENLATVSALMESIEIWHGENLPKAQVVGSYNQLIHSYPLYPIESFQTALFSPKITSQSLGWVAVQHLVSNAIRYLPHTCFNQDRVNHGEGFELFWPTSNGLASGNSQDEAICHALFELVERDCITKITPFMLETRQLDLNFTPSDACTELIEKIKHRGYLLKIYDIKSELNIPCYYATIDDSHDIRNIGLFAGFGCHFSDEIALLRALTEAAQSRLTYISGARDDIIPRFYQQKRDIAPEQSQALYRPQFNLDMPKSMADCLTQLVNCLYVHGYKDQFVYSLTRAEIGIPVVHVVVPGLLFDKSRHLFKMDARL